MRPLRPGSISTRITLWAMLIASVAIISLGAVSLHFMRQGLLAQIEGHADYQARIYANNTGAALRTLLHDAKGISENLIVVSAMIDTMGREVYLGPFLRDYASPEGIALTLSLYDFEGRLMSSSQAGRGDHERPGNVARLIEDAAPLAYIEEGAGGPGGTLHIEYPVFYEATGMAEGFIVMEAPMGQVMQEAIRREFIAGEGRRVELLVGDRTVWGTDDVGEEVFQRVMALDLPPPLDGLGLAVRFSRSAEGYGAALGRLIATHLAIGALVLCVTFMAARAVAARIVRPLADLRGIAHEIAESGSPGADLGPLMGLGDETGDLAISMHVMLGRLAEAQATLEGRVLERTAELAAREAHLRDILSSIRDTLIIADEHRVIREVNQPALREMFGYETPEALGNDSRMLYAQLQGYEAAGRAVYDEPGAVAGRLMQSEFRRKDGSVFPAELFALKLVDERGMVMGNMAVIRDITERKRSEGEIVRQLREKEVLLREVHHRVKNNMAVIAALLNMQASLVKDPLYKGMFRESNNRIRSMALVHELLYRAGDLAYIDTGEYLRALVGQVGATQALGDAVRVSVEAEPLPLTIDTLIPCGLIVNELLTNAYKYAFGEGGGGTLRVGLSRTGGGAEALLEVEDNGRGLPEGFDPAGTSGGLGYKLIAGLTKQLRGRLTIEAGRGGTGTRAALRFPMPSSDNTVGA